MKRIVILGAGTAGTIMANHLHKELDKSEWQIDIIDERKEHYYQPGYLFLPFDIYKPNDIDTAQTHGSHVQVYGNGAFITNKEIETLGLARRPSTAAGVCVVRSRAQAAARKPGRPAAQGVRVGERGGALTRRAHCATVALRGRSGGQ